MRAPAEGFAVAETRSSQHSDYVVADDCWLRDDHCGLRHIAIEIERGRNAGCRGTGVCDAIHALTRSAITRGDGLAVLKRNAAMNVARIGDRDAHAGIRQIGARHRDILSTARREPIVSPATPEPAEVRRVAVASFIAETRPVLSGTLKVMVPSPEPYVVPQRAKAVAYVVREMAWPAGKMKELFGAMVSQ
jgi:hypothetical protein